MTTATLPAIPNPQSLGAALERQRLEHRQRRLKRVLAALEDRRTFREKADGSVPPALREAIGGFRQELGEVERRLDLLAR